jgi:hypothetical protein
MALEEVASKREKVGWVRQGAKGRQKAESTFTETIKC